MSYCSSFYGCLLWSLRNKEVAVFCATWRKGARRIETPTPNSHCDLLYVIANHLSIFDEVCRHMYNFLFHYLSSDSRFMKSIVLRGQRYAGSTSPITGSAILCSLHLRMKFSFAAIRRLSCQPLCSEIDFSRDCL
jgi:hypothetical protein